MRKLLREGAAVMVPLSFAVIPVVGMLWIQARTLPPPAVSVARIGALLVATVGLLYSMLRRRSAAVASNTVGLPLLVLGFYPAAHAAARAAAWGEPSLPYMYLVLCLLSAWVAFRLSPQATAALNDILAIVAAVLVVFTTALLYRVYFRPVEYASPVQQAMGHLSTPLVVPGRPQWTPDVYDLVLDGMGRPDVLEREWGLALNSQIDGFRRVGFEIVANGHANYAQTQLSLSSMLNGGYLDELASAEGASNERGPLRDLISAARVPDAFKRLGYRVEFIGSGYLSSGAFVRSDVCDCPQLWFADAEVGALSLSPLQVLSGGVGGRAHYERSLAIFDAFERPWFGNAPRYVFAHVPMPHPPFVADERGEFTNPSRLFSGGDGSFFGGSPDEYKAGYRAQAVFTLSRALRSVTRILEDGAKRGRDVIIIVHGDHGPRLGFDAKSPTAASGQLALPILLAIRWPPGRAPDNDPVSLVNVYRTLFQHVFQVDLPPLADRAYVSGFDTPYVLIPVPAIRSPTEE